MAELLNSRKYLDVSGLEYYELEYQVRKRGAGGWMRHNIAVLCAHQGLLYTLNAQVSADRWDTVAPVFQTAAASFRVQK
jgi:hypothetical protein